MRVLIVDDDDDIREVLELILRMTGHAADGVADGERALALLRAARFDLILLDLVMPMMDGLDFLTAYRDLPTGARAPVILMTAAPEQLTALPPATEVCAIIEKPFDVDVLLALIERMAHAPARETTPPDR